MSQNKTRILYIEDDATNRILVRKLLSIRGYDVLEAEDGISGIDVARDQEPDLILMDMNMPGLDGYEASTRIKGMQGLGQVPIIAVTANAMSGDRERSLVAGCDGYISKPRDPDNFVDEIEQYLGGKKEQVSDRKRSGYLKEYSDRLVRRLEQKIRDLSEALEQAEQASEAKSRFLKIIGHELRTPLNAVINAPDLVRLQNPQGLNEQQGQLLDMITRNGRQLLGMIDNVLQYTALQDNTAKLDLESLDIRTLADQVVEKYRAQAEEKGLSIGWDCVCATDLPLWQVDRNYVSRVLGFLIDNAIKFTGQGGVKVCCQAVPGSRVELPPEQCKVLDAGQLYMQVCISDTGIGIDEADITRVLDGLSQQDDSSTRRYGGIGIGLAMARRMVDIHGGCLWASGKPGQGSRFCFVLPQTPVGGVN